MEAKCRTQRGKKCVFPFFFDGLNDGGSFYGCADFIGNGRLACPLAVDEHNWFSPVSENHRSDYCDESCPVHDDLMRAHLDVDSVAEEDEYQEFETFWISEEILKERLLNFYISEITLVPGFDHRSPKSKFSGSGSERQIPATVWACFLWALVQ